MVALLSRDAALYSTRSIKQAFLDAGHEVLILDVLQLEVKIGRGVFSHGKKLSPEFIIPRFSSGILLAGLAVLKEWEREGIPSLNASHSISLAHDQLATLQALSQAGLPIPESSFCSQPEGDETLNSLIGTSPKVIKLLDSAQGKGVTLAENAQTVRSLLSTLASLHSSGVTQEYYPDSKGQDRRLLVLNGKVIKAITRTARPTEFRANVHQGGTVSAYTPTEEETDLAIRAAEVLGLEFAGVDLLPTERGSLILEVNASPGLEGIEMGDVGSLAKLLPRVLQNS